MRGLSKVTIAKEALFQLEQIRELAEEYRKLEGNAAANACYRRQAQSASYYLKAIEVAGLMPPQWYISRLAYFKVCGWHT